MGTVISTDGLFEWEEEKNKMNIRKHGISFEYAIMTFDDPFVMERFDEEHSIEENRYEGIGNVDGVIVLASYYTFRDNERIRMISSRIATPREEKEYYARKKAFYP